MAKRRKLTAPSQDDLNRIEAEFRGETAPRSGPMAPIAQVAAETARSVDVLGPETRTKLLEGAQAQGTLKDAEEQGRLMLDLPLEQVEADALFRDRVVMDPEALDELRRSVAKTGLRLPIEVYKIDGEGETYGLISGYRRLMVVRQLHAKTRDPKYARIKAVVRPIEASADQFAAVVEENEVRANLTHFERGRFAALTVGKGVFPTVEAAVDMLYPFASKAKRSKIRSFALIFEEVGDLLSHAEAMTEKQGLRLASALRSGASETVREALGDGATSNFAEEWARVEPAIALSEAGMRDTTRGGRPAKRKKLPDVELSWDQDKDGYLIRLTGRGLTPDAVEGLVSELKRLMR